MHVESLLKKFFGQAYDLSEWVVFVFKIVANFVSNFFKVSIALLTTANASLMSSWFTPVLELWAVFTFFGRSLLLCLVLYIVCYEARFEPFSRVFSRRK